MLQILADSNIPVHKNPHELAEDQILPVAAVQVIHLATVLAMHSLHVAQANAAQLGFQGGHIAAVDNSRAKFPQQATQSPVAAQVVALSLVQLNDLHILGGDSLHELIRGSQADDDMSITIRR